MLARRKTETKKRQQKKRIDKLNQKRGTTLEFTEGTSKSRRPTRAAAAKSRAAITELAEKEGIESTISEITDTQAVKWDKYLSIYKEYVETFDELFDKWTSLRLFEKLEDSTKNV